MCYTEPSNFRKSDPLKRDTDKKHVVLEGLNFFKNWWSQSLSLKSMLNLCTYIRIYKYDRYIYIYIIYCTGSGQKPVTVGK